MIRPRFEMRTFDDYGQAVTACRRRNRSVRGLPLRYRLAAVVDGPEDGQWTVMEADEAADFPAAEIFN